MNKAKANLWLFNKKTKDITFSYEVKQKARFVKGSLIAVLLGLILGGIIIAIENVNPFEYLAWLFKIGFNDIFTERTIQWFCVYIIAALAVGIGFKAGMFNIGVAGQMMMGGGISIIFYKLAVEQNKLAMNAGYVIVIFLICIFSGAIMAAIAGALKALFNIHEVVTTIMLNWTTWYLMKYLFTTKADTIGGQGIQASGQIPAGAMNIGGSSIVIPIILAAISVVVVAVLLSKSIFGFKVKAIGASPDASKYAGYDVKKKMIESMAISGALAGVASFISILTISPQYSFNVDNLPTVGYDAIAITLVAFNNPIGTVFSSFLWAILQSAGASAASMFNMPTQISQLIFGVIVYFAAISVVFINWYPILKLRIQIALSGSKADQIKIKNLHKEQLKYRNELLNINKAKDVADYKAAVEQQIADQKVLLANAKNDKQKAAIKSQISELKREMNLFVKEYRKNLKEMIKKCSEEIKILKNNNYVSKINSAKEGIERRKFDSIRNVEEDALSKVNLIRSNQLGLEDKYAEDLKVRKNWLKNKLHSLKKEYKFKLKQNAVWMESETGIKNHFWEMRNGRIESQATINKMKIATHNQILNIKSDAEMTRLSLESTYRKNPQKLVAKIDALNKKTRAAIKKAKAKLKKDIQLEHQHVAELTKTYKETKKANEELARKIVAKKKAFNSKLYKQSPINKELVHDSDLLLKELYFENQRDKKAVEKINNQNNTDGASLVDIRLAYNERKRNIDEWYKQECKRAIDKHNAFVKQYDDEHSAKLYEQAKAVIDNYEEQAKKLGTDNSGEVVDKKRKLLKDVISKIKKIWPEEYSDTDPTKWSKKRLRIYNRINRDQADLSVVSVVSDAENQIQNINAKYKWINQNYKENIYKFKDQYKVNKQVNVVLAQQKYHKQVEDFISKLEKYDFIKNENIREVK